MLFKEDAVARAEAKAVRANVGWYRWTHDLVEVSGSGAEEFLDWMLVNKIVETPCGRGRYTTMLDEDGLIIDDLVAFNRGGGAWWLSTLYGPQAVRWFEAHKAGCAVAFADITQTWDMYAIQGPNSAKMMNALLGQSVNGFKRFQIADASVGDVAVVVDRGGFTGELGFELFCKRKDSAAVEQAIAASAAEFDAPRLTTLEVYVRSLPMEKGLALRQDYRGLTPYEANLGWSVHLEKDFVGKDALVAAHAEGERRAFVGVEIERESYEDIAQGEILYKRGVPRGRVTQMIYGYTVDKNIGFAVVDAKRCPIGTRVTIGCNESPAVLVDPKWC